MKRLKLFEDFEEKSFYKLDAEEWTSAFIESIPFSLYSVSNMDNKLKSRLSTVFGHNDFYYSKEGNQDYEWIYIYERLHSLVHYKIFLSEDEWFYMQSNNRAVGSPPGIIHYYKCDDIKGLIAAIKYDYEEINERVGLYYRLPARQGMYGEDGVKKQFFGAQSVLLDTYKNFPIYNFPKQEVYKILPEIYLPTVSTFGYKNSLNLKVEDNIAKITSNDSIIDLFYIKETNRFNCADLPNYDYWTCLGIEGLKSLLNIIMYV